MYVGFLSTVPIPILNQHHFNVQYIFCGKQIGVWRETLSKVVGWLCNHPTVLSNHPAITRREEVRLPLCQLYSNARDNWCSPLKKVIALCYENMVTGSARKMRLATLTDEELTRTLDLSSFGLGHMTVAALLSQMVFGHIDNMCGEISVLKGLQGAKGYPI